MSLAKINGLFRLTRDAEIVTAQSGSTITKLGIACSEKYKDKETQLFLDAVAFGKTGEIISQYAGSKGTQIYLSGKLQTESWTTQDGQKRNKTSMTIESFDFVNSGNRDNQSNNTQTNNYAQHGNTSPQSNNSQANQQRPQPTYDNQNCWEQPQQQARQAQLQNNVPEIDIDEETLPF